VGVVLDGFVVVLVVEPSIPAVSNWNKNDNVISFK
jgi:hypothetical protein